MAEVRVSAPVIRPAPGLVRGLEIAIRASPSHLSPRLAETKAWTCRFKISRSKGGREGLSGIHSSRVVRSRPGQ